MKSAINLLKDGLKYLSWLGEKLDPNYEIVLDYNDAIKRAFDLGKIPEAERQQQLFDPEEYRKMHESEIIERLNDLIIPIKQEGVLMAAKGNLHMLEILKRTMQTLRHALLEARITTDALIERHNESIDELETSLKNIATSYGQTNAAYNTKGFLPFLKELHCEPIVTDEELEEVKEIFNSEDDNILAIRNAASNR